MVDTLFKTKNRLDEDVDLPTAKLLDDTLRELIGEDVASPAANSLGDRLKTLAAPLGAPTDPAWTTGAGSIPALLKAIAGALGAIDATDASAANQATLNTAVGAIADAAWGGTGNGSLIALFKVVALQLLDTSPAAVILGSLTTAQTTALVNALATEVTLNSILTNTPTKGQKTKTGSSPTVLASDHDPIDTVVKATAASRSTSAGVAAAVLMPANALRRGFSVQNQHATAKIYINGSGTAVVADGSSLMIGPGQYFESNPTHSGGGAISIISDTAATPVYAREW